MVGEVLAAQTGVDIQTNCLYSSMKVIMASQQPFTGYMFAKNKFWTCGVQVQNSANAQLVLSFPRFAGAQNDCGVIALVWTFIHSMKFFLCHKLISKLYRAQASIAQL